jgi:hypothetical protein
MATFTGTPRQPKKEGGETTIFTRGRLERFMVDSIKAPFMRGVFALKSIEQLTHLPEMMESFNALKKLPVPDKGNTRWRNTDVLLDIRDEAFRQKLVPVPEFVALPIVNCAIIIYDYDPYYQQRIDWLYSRLKEEGWRHDDADANLTTLKKLRDEFFSLENNPGREKAFRLIWDLTIRFYGMPHYQSLVDWAVSKWLACQWEPREPGRPRPPTWREFEIKK